ncbi:YceD family protein [Lentisalinibacter salinarum]|uniref:YceD family protein n=1 Tax=Lentisalinibacter salinarum TaxID=2992239 RepID=UPI0038689505
MLQAVRPDALAARREEIRDTIPLGSTDRLAGLVREVLTRCDGEVPGDWERRPLVVELDFESRRVEGNQPVPAVTGKARVTLPLVCERCLGSMELALEAEIALLLPDADMTDEALPGFEVWPVEGRGVRLLDPVEEELLLALPLALMHEDRSRCRPVTEHYAADDAEAEPDTQRPFSALKTLLSEDKD